MFNRFMNSRGTLLAAGAFFALLLLCGGATLIRALTDDNDRTASPAPSPTTAPSSSASLCPTDVDTAVPTKRLPDLRWERLGPVLLPYSAAAGPCMVTATTAAGYAHTPAGAILAAAQIGSRTSITDPLAIATDTIKQQALPGPARDQLLSKTEQQSKTPLTEQDAGQLTAWSVLSYSDDTAVISLALSNPAGEGQYVTLPVTMRWSDGDWRLVPPPGGSWDSSAAVTPTLQGYVEWGKP